MVKVIWSGAYLSDLVSFSKEVGEGKLVRNVDTDDAFFSVNKK